MGGARDVNVGGARCVNVGGASGVNVGGASDVNVGGASGVNVGGARDVNVGGASDVNVGGASDVNVGGASGVNVGGASGVNVGGASGVNVGGASGVNVGGASGVNVGGASGVNVGGASGVDLKQGSTAKASQDALYIPSVQFPPMLVKLRFEQWWQLTAPVIAQHSHYTKHTADRSIGDLCQGQRLWYHYDQSANSYINEQRSNYGGRLLMELVVGNTFGVNGDKRVIGWNFGQGWIGYGLKGSLT